MSIVLEQVRRVDGELDKLQLGRLSFATTLSNEELTSSTRIPKLQGIIKALSTTSSSSPLLSRQNISALLAEAEASGFDDVRQQQTKNPYETELEWLLVSKATTQAYGIILNTLLGHTIPICDDIWYWDEVLGSYAYSTLYSVQTSPLRFWKWGKETYYDVSRRFYHLRHLHDSSLAAQSLGTGLSAQWKEFYGLVQDSIRDRSISEMRRRVLSPVAISRSEARRKQTNLKRLRELSASGLGVLVEEGLHFDVEDDLGHTRATDDNSEWKMVVERSVSLMDSVLRHVTTLDATIPEFEDGVFAAVSDDPEASFKLSDAEQHTVPARLVKRLQKILNDQIPAHIATSNKIAAQSGRPPRLVRYWLPAAALLLSSTTILPILVRRRAAIVEWITDLGSTIRDFWFNWVIEPTRKIISTIRHDGDSELALMSRESLKGDRDSLERMVVDFAMDHPSSAGVSGALNDAQIAEIRAKVKEGDLTPVLRAYEQDLRRPLMGTVRGDLVRTLLIQVQKTKVDVEVALNGIDSLLKSQELVFGFVGLTPGILVCLGAWRYLEGTFGNRRSLRTGRKAGQSIRILRNIDRILTLSRPSPDGIINYKDHGLLLCEIHTLRDRAQQLFPSEVEREFVEDVNELADIRIGVERQLRVLERLRWAYSKWWQK